MEERGIAFGGLSLMPPQLRIAEFLAPRHDQCFCPRCYPKEMPDTAQAGGQGFPGAQGDPLMSKDTGTADGTIICLFLFMNKPSPTPRGSTSSLVGAQGVAGACIGV